jgi:hypothetical protein
MMNFDFSNPQLIVVLVVLVVAVMIGVAFYLQKRKRTTAELRNRFGSEYDRAVLEYGSEAKAEAKLADREARVEKLKIRDLTEIQRLHFLKDWHEVESRFLDHPKGAVIEADELLSSLLLARGYPVTDFQQSAEDISVTYPRMMDYYRSAHAIALRTGDGQATTEELRTAMIDYRTLFDELVQSHTPIEPVVEGKSASYSHR